MDPRGSTSCASRRASPTVACPPSLLAASRVARRASSPKAGSAVCAGPAKHARPSAESADPDPDPDPYPDPDPDPDPDLDPRRGNFPQVG